MRRTLLFVGILLLAVSGLEAQDEPVFNIKNPGEAKAKRCKDYFEVVASMPAEVRYTVTEKDRQLYLIFNSQEYFDLIFNQKTDGFAIDIIHKDQYRCDSPQPNAQSWAHKGTLLPPVYKPTFDNTKQLANNGAVVVPYGSLPEEFEPQDVEYNLLIVQKNWLCDNQYFYSIDYDTWSLLPTGFYRDSIQAEIINRFTELKKTLHFTVPFKKDQTIFKPADVKPIYDSLNLTDYLIKKISIKAFSSVEGPLERNIRLQEGRAQSIVDALKAYQAESITSEITASENWIEFRQDVRNTEFAHFEKMDMQAVKDQLDGNEQLLAQIEPILGRHRKAEIEINLEKRINPESGNPELIKRLFAQSLEVNELDEALYLQELAFKAVKEKRLPESFIGELDLPESADYGSLLNNRAIFYAENSPEDLQTGIDSFGKLVMLLPNNRKVLYNYTTLKIQQWANSETQTRRKDVNALITQLERMELDPGLLRTLKVNYHIVLTKYLNEERNFAMKNRSLRFIYNEYRRVFLEDDKRLRLARYMAYYSRFDWAESLLKTRVQEVGISTDIIFYYINLTITNSSRTRRPDYQIVLDRAIKRDKDRFCQLFAPKTSGGITFQLLDDINLRKKFCEVCSAPSSPVTKNTGKQ